MIPRMRSSTFRLCHFVLALLLISSNVSPPTHYALPAEAAEYPESTVNGNPSLEPEGTPPPIAATSTTVDSRLQQEEHTLSAPVELQIGLKKWVLRPNSATQIRLAVRAYGDERVNGLTLSVELPEVLTVQGKKDSSWDIPAMAAGELFTRRLTLKARARDLNLPATYPITARISGEEFETIERQVWVSIVEKQNNGRPSGPKEKSQRGCGRSRRRCDKWARGCPTHRAAEYL